MCAEGMNMTHSLALLLVLCSVLAAVGASADVPAKIDLANLPAHPRLLLTAKGVAEMKDRIERNDWARDRWNAVKAHADENLAEEIVLPPRGGNWTHWYTCPEHGCALQTGKKISDWHWEHKCPVGGELLVSDPSKASSDYDGCLIENAHHGWAKSAVGLGLAYQVTGDIRYANKSRDILLAYADKYLTYPIHNNQGELKPGARMGSQNLDESIWMIDLCHGADLIWDTLAQTERDAIANKLMLPSVNDIIIPKPYGIHNIQCWRNSAIGLVGLLLGDKTLVELAIAHPESGFYAQMEKGVTPDGQWREGAWGYHFYTMSAIWSLNEAARNCGIDLYCATYKSMFDGPLKFTMPNVHLPAFNDSSEVNLSAGSAIYELAYARYKDPMFVELLSRSNRKSDFALWFGEPVLPAAPKMDWQSVNYPKSGYAILAKGQGTDATWLCVKYGPHGGGHGHPDKLSFVLYSKGEVMGLDPGTTRYGSPMHLGWCKTTFSHNTLIVDEESQKPSEGRAIAFGTENGVEYTVCDAGPICDGVRFNRTAALMDENLVVFIDQIRSDKEHLFDLAYHQAGAWDNLPRGTTWQTPDKRSYEYLKDGTSRKTSNGITLNAKSPNGTPVEIGLAGGAPVEVITATGPGRNITERVPAVIFRSRAKEFSTAWYISLDAKPARIERMQVLGDDGKEAGVSVAAVSVTSGGKTRILVANPEKRSVRVTLADGSEWRVDSAFAVR